MLYKHFKNLDGRKKNAKIVQNWNSLCVNASKRCRWTDSVDYLSQHFEFLWYSKLNFFKQIIFLNFFIVINAFQRTSDGCNAKLPVKWMKSSFVDFKNFLLRLLL